MKKAILFAILAITSCALSHAASMRFYLPLDCLTVPEFIKKGNASFSIVYQFKVDEELHPTEILKVTDDFIGIDKVKSCLKEWEFGGVCKNMKYTLVLYWRHSMGWISLSIIGDDLDIRIKL